MNLRERPRVAAVLVAIGALALVAAGCGGDGGGEDEAEVSTVIANSIQTEDERLLCEELIAPGYVAEIYGDAEGCMEAEAPSPDDGPKPQEVIVSDIEIDGDRATATVEELGGDTDGATGTVTVAREDGTWRISELGTDYLRSTLSQGLANADSAEEGPMLEDPELRSCIDEQLQQLDDESFRRLAYESMADAEPNEDFLSAFSTCAGDEGLDGDAPREGLSGEPSVIRQQFEQGIRESALSDDVSTEAIDCILGELRTSVTDEEIVDEVAGGSEKPSPGLAGKVAQAMASC